MELRVAVETAMEVRAGHAVARDAWPSERDQPISDRVPGQFRHCSKAELAPEVAPVHFDSSEGNMRPGGNRRRAHALGDQP